MLKIAAAFAAAALATAASAVAIVTVEAAGVTNTTVALAESGVETFTGPAANGITSTSTFGGGVFTGTFGKHNVLAANRYGGADETGYYQVRTGAALLTLSGRSTNYFGLWASALDGSNSVRFLRGGATIDTFVLPPFALPAAYKGNPNAAFAGQVGSQYFAFFNFHVFGGYDQVQLIQGGGGGFESDNITVGTIPEPATWGLTATGFGLIGTGMRRRSRVNIVYA